MSDEDLSSSSSEEEDDCGKELTLDVEKSFLKTLQCLKTKDPSIYDSNVKFFEKTSNDEKESDIVKEQKKKKTKPFLLRDYDKLLVESGGEIKEETDIQPSYAEEQDEIKSNLKKALLDSNSDDDSDNNLFTLKTKKSKHCNDEKTPSSDEETEIKDWLIGARDKLKDKSIEQELKPLHDIWTNPKLDDGETFLRDYILNKKYLEDKNVNDSKSESDNDADSDFDAKQEEFEHKYNFRFEEPDDEFIKRYPRTVTSSMRRKESKRKLKREQSKQNKIDKLEKKKVEIKKLKKEKREEIFKHLESLKNLTGNTSLAFKENFMEGEFSPDDHDKLMQQLFNEEFYTGKDDEKPVFSDGLDEMEYDGQDYDLEEGGDEEVELDKNYGEGEEVVQEENAGEGYSQDFAENELIMDCDFDPSQPIEKKLSRSKQKRRNRKMKQQSKSLFAQLVQKPKPLFNPENETFMKYVDEYYGLEFEDLIGDLPCRFKYKKVVPNSFGLTIEEILAADDAELNKWCSMKKIHKTRPEHIERNEAKVYGRRAEDEQLKRKLLPSLFKQEDKGDDDQYNQKILPTDEERKEIIQKKKREINETTEEFEIQKKNSSNAEMNQTKQDKNGDIVDEKIVNEYLKGINNKKNQKRKLKNLNENKQEMKKIKLNDDKQNGGVTKNKNKQINNNIKNGMGKRKNEGDVNNTKGNENEDKKNSDDTKVDEKKKIILNKKLEEVMKNSDSTKVDGKKKRKKQKKKEEIDNEGLEKNMENENGDKTKSDGTKVDGKKKIILNKKLEEVMENSDKSNIDSTKVDGKKKRKKRKKKKEIDNEGLEKNMENENGEKSNCDSAKVEAKKKKKKRKKKKKKKVENEDLEESVNNSKTNKLKNTDQKIQKLKRKISDKNQKRMFDTRKKQVKIEYSDSRLKAYGINPKKYKSKLIYGNKDGAKS